MGGGVGGGGSGWVGGYITCEIYHNRLWSQKRGGHYSDGGHTLGDHCTPSSDLLSVTVQQTMDNLSGEVPLPPNALFLIKASS